MTGVEEVRIEQSRDDLVVERSGLLMMLDIDIV